MRPLQLAADMSSTGFEGALRRFLDHFEKISNCADEDVFLKEFMVSDQSTDGRSCDDVGSFTVNYLPSLRVQLITP